MLMGISLFKGKNMNDPFKILEPTVISVSGGRTSGYLLYRVLEANNGKLPEDSLAVFANTGKEAEQTLEFVKNCADKWNVEIHWVEYRSNEKKFEIVDFDTASRKGEPFEAMIDRYEKLPNTAIRMCTGELKKHTIHRFVKEKWAALGHKHGKNTDWMGIRADEPRRVARFERHQIPLVVAGITKHDVGKFWANNDFDLELPNINGTTNHSNCDLCFLKSEGVLMSLIRENPEKANWWIAQEEKTGMVFSINTPTYKKKKEFAKTQTELFEFGESIPCYCGD